MGCLGCTMLTTPTARSPSSPVNARSTSCRTLLSVWSSSMCFVGQPRYITTFTLMTIVCIFGANGEFVEVPVPACTAAYSKIWREFCPVRNQEHCAPSVCNSKGVHPVCYARPAGAVLSMSYMICLESYGRVAFCVLRKLCTYI